MCEHWLKSTLYSDMSTCWPLCIPDSHGGYHSPTAFGFRDGASELFGCDGLDRSEEHQVFQSVPPLGFLQHLPHDETEATCVCEEDHRGKWPLSARRARSATLPLASVPEPGHVWASHVQPTLRERGAVLPLLRLRTTYFGWISCAQETRMFCLWKPLTFLVELVGLCFKRHNFLTAFSTVHMLFF